MTHHPSSRSYEPATFLDRGVSVPFTCPGLAGARVRLSAAAELELLVPNPSGGRGTYILPWTGLRSFCRPTVYDIKLTERLAGLKAVTPATVRRASRQIAAEGFAGRAAGLHAEAALAAEQQTILVTNSDLVRRIIQQEEAMSGVAPLPANDPNEIGQRTDQALASLASLIEETPATIATGLEVLAELYTPIGLDDRSASARLPGAIERVKTLRHEALSLLTIADEHASMLIHTLLSSADLIVAGGGHALADARAASGQIASLLAEQHGDALALRRRLMRAEWLVDGWERVCQIWSLDPRPAARGKILDEIVALLPALPTEASDWPGIATEDPLSELHHLVSGHVDWRTGQCVHDTVARNEAMLAV